MEDVQAIPVVVAVDQVVEMADVATEGFQNSRKGPQFLAGEGGVLRNVPVALRESAQMHQRNCKNLTQKER